MTAPLIIAFSRGSSLYRERDRPSDLKIHRNGPPGTFVRIGNTRVSLPTDQIVDSDESGGGARVGFGGMQFTGLEGGRLTFARVRDLWPDDRLSPARSWKMTLDPAWVTTVHEEGRQVWPAERGGSTAR